MQMGQKLGLQDTAAFTVFETSNTDEQRALKAKERILDTVSCNQGNLIFELSRVVLCYLGVYRATSANVSPVFSCKLCSTETALAAYCTFTALSCRFLMIFFALFF